MKKTVKRIATHIVQVQKALAVVYGELQNRAIVHDQSKFKEDELEGYARYRADFPEGLRVWHLKNIKLLKSRLNVGVGSNNGFGLHSSRNDHHPEFHENAHSGTTLDVMGLFPIIEMVCDWAGAHTAYGNESDWFESVDYNVKRYNFSDMQKWVIGEVATLLYQNMPELSEKRGDHNQKLATSN